MKKYFIFLFLSIELDEVNSQSFRDNFIGSFTGTVDIYENGSQYHGTDLVTVNPSATDSNNIIITDTIPWLNYEYVLHPDFTFTDIWMPNLKHGYFYSNGDSIYIYDVHNSPWYREWHCGKAGASVPQRYHSPFSIFPNPATERIFISSINADDDLTLTLQNTMGKCILEFTQPFYNGMMELAMPKLPPGIYSLRIRTLNMSHNHKLIIH